MQKRFDSFPYNQKLWVLSINQLHDVENSLVFSNEVTEEFDLTGYDFNLVTDLIIGSGVNEFHAYGNHTRYLQETINNCHIKFPNLQNIYILYTTIYFEEEKLASKCPLTCIYLPYFLLRSTLTDLTQFTNWNPIDKRAIFPIGDIRNRPHRFPLLYYFQMQGDLNLLNYSLHNTHYYDYFHENGISFVCRCLVEMFNHHYTYSEFENLYNSLVKYFPDDEDYINRTKHYGLSIYTHNYPGGWNDAACNLVTETNFYKLPHNTGKNRMNVHTECWLSEKVWKPILSGKPFIIINENDAIYFQLEKMGFKTFLNYTNHPEKAQFTNVPMDDWGYYKKHIMLCHERTKNFLENIEKYKDDILADTLHNKEKWKELSTDAWEDLYRKCPPIKQISKDEFCDMFNCHDFHCAKYRYMNWKDK